VVIARCDYGPRDEKRCKKSLKNPASSNPDHSLYEEKCYRLRLHRELQREAYTLTWQCNAREKINADME
jgi:hypothetical protein